MIITENKKVSMITEAKQALKESKELLKEIGFEVISASKYKELKEKAEKFEKVDANFDKLVEEYLNEKGLIAVEKDYKDKVVEELNNKINEDVIIETLEEEGYVVLSKDEIAKIDESLKKLGINEEQIASLFEADEDEEDDEDEKEGNAIDLDNEIKKGEKEVKETEDELEESCKSKKDKKESDENNDDDDDDEDLEESIKKQLNLTEKLFETLSKENKLDEEVKELNENVHIIDKIIP